MVTFVIKQHAQLGTVLKCLKYPYIKMLSFLTCIYLVQIYTAKKDKFNPSPIYGI